MKRLCSQVLGMGAAIAASALWLTACSSADSESAMPGGPGGGQRPAVPVLAAHAERVDLPISLNEAGRVEAFASVAVKSQAGGQLLNVHFTEGQDVAQGDLLFTIDDRSYQASLHQAEANLARDRIQAENAQANANRYAEMMKQNAAAAKEYEQAAATAEALAAQVKADEAAVENARLLLSYCTIVSPVSGRTGNVLIDEGNIVKANDAALVHINQIEPVKVNFAVPERHLPDIKRYMATGEALEVRAAMAGGDASPETGALTFLDNAVDPDTGTIRLQATFPNEDRRLWPGQFVNISLLLATRTDSVVVPQAAVQNSQEGQYVYIIGPDMAVEHCAVATGMTVGERIVIEEGLEGGEQVVTDGHINLIPGFKVTLKEKLLEEGEAGVEIARGESDQAH